MSICFAPRLSQAANLLPVLRAQLAAAGPRHPLPEGFAFELLPIVDDGVFGYELLPRRETHTYLTIGCDSGGRPVLRKCSYCAAAPSALRLATVNGRALTQGEFEAWHRIQPRDFWFPDWPSAAEATWREFAALFPDGPRCPVEIHDAGHRRLDEALAIANSFLAAWDARIDFCGIPDEAQYGIALSGGNGESGRLLARATSLWGLRWEAEGHALHEHWAATAPDDEDGFPWACAGTKLGHAPLRRAPFAFVDSGATSGQR
jgi:hypothetical protein